MVIIEDIYSYPFCIAKCGYCDFYSVPIGRSMDWQEQYLRGLVAEMEQRASFYDGQRIITIYIGGGTPSLLTSEQIDRLLNKLAATFTLSSDIEITIEANPATVNEKYLQECRQAGVNRLSLGVQSFIDRELCLLGRLHSTQDSKEAIRAARAAGFTNLNLDLIYGIPGQTTDDWTANSSHTQLQSIYRCIYCN